MCLQAVGRAVIDASSNTRSMNNCCMFRFPHDQSLSIHNKYTSNLSAWFHDITAPLVSASAVASPGFSPRGHDKHMALNSLFCADVPLSNYSLTTNMFTKAGIHHRNVYIKKYDKLAHLITHKMAWSFQRQASAISIKTVNNTSSVNLLYNIPFNTTKQKFLESFLSAARSQFILNQC